MSPLRVMCPRALGFTIVELVVVIILLGVLSATAISRFVNPTAFAPGSTSTAMSAQAHYATQMAQAGTNPIALALSQSGANWVMDVRDGVVSLRDVRLGVANTTIELANDGNTFVVDAAASLTAIFANDGELQSASVGAAVLNVDVGMELRIIGDSTHVLCFYPTGYVSAQAC